MKYPDLCEWWTPERLAEEDAIWQRDKRYLEYAREVNRVCAVFSLKTVLELGCGIGYVSQYLDKTLVYTGADGSKVVVDEANKRFPDVDIYWGDIRRLDGGNVRERDLVCAFAVLKHFSLADTPEVLGKMLAVGRYGLIQVQLRLGVFESVEEKFPGQDAYHSWTNEQDLHKIVTSLGHKVIWLEDTGMDTSPYMAHSREAYMVTKRL